jgi:serine/threonine protein kinase
MLQKTNTVYDKEEAIREIEILRSLDNPLIPKIIDVVKDPNG